MISDTMMEINNEYAYQVYQYKCSPPFSPAMYGNFQILPNPMADPVTASMKVSLMTIDREAMSVPDCLDDYSLINDDVYIES